MNTTSTSINPATAIQPQPTAGKQQDAKADEVPFSQVLSSEIAQKRQNSDDTRKSSDANTVQDTTSKASGQTEEDDTSPLPSAMGEAPAGQLAQGNVSAIVPETLLGQILIAEEHKLASSIESSEYPSALAIPTSVTMASPATEDAPSTPEAVLALAVNSAQPKSSAAKTASVDAKQSSTIAANNLPFRQQGKSVASQSAQHEQSLSDPAHDTSKNEPVLPGKTGFQTTAVAAALSAQPGTASRQPDQNKPGELVSDIMSNPAMRSTTHGPLEIQNLPPELVSSKLSPSVGTAAWGQALGEKIVWMAAGAQQTATLTLNPPNMGPLQIVLNVSNDQATASFFSAQPEVRQALETALPRLREMMNDAGIELGQATVSSDTPRQNDTPDRQAQRLLSPFAGTNDPVTAGLQGIHMQMPQSGRGLVDTFA